jgi:hypothetical protein
MADKILSQLYLTIVNSCVKKSKKKRKIVPFKYFVKNRGFDATTMPNTAFLPAAAGSMQPSL